MRYAEYKSIKREGLTQEQLAWVMVDVLSFVDDAGEIFFKDGKYNPIKWHSFKRWVLLGKLAIKLFKRIISILKQ